MSDTAIDFGVIHPLDDAPEQKLFSPELGRIGMTRPVRLSLMILRLYLALMLVLVGARLVAGL